MLTTDVVSSDSIREHVEGRSRRFRSRGARPLLAVLVALLACTSCVKPIAAVPIEVVNEADATLGPGDEFEVRIYNEKELSGKFQVGPDGTIGFPFLGIVAVSGKDTRQIAQEISEKLERGGYLRNPYVSVFLEESNSKRISVIGAVAKPGTLQMIPGMTVVQAISQVGGFTPLASKDDTVVSRRKDKKLERYRIRVTEIARGDAEDFQLRSGDIIFVPERMF